MSELWKMCPFIARFRAVESHYHPLNHIFHAFGGMSCFFLLIMNRLGWNIWKMSILTVLKTQYYSKKYNRCHKIGWTHHPEFTNLIFRHKIIFKSLPILTQHAFWINFWHFLGHSDNYCCWNHSKISLNPSLLK